MKLMNLISEFTCLGGGGVMWAEVFMIIGWPNFQKMKTILKYCSNIEFENGISLFFHENANFSVPFTRRAFRYFCLFFDMGVGKGRGNGTVTHA